MLCSMTAYGQAELETDDCSVRCEIRSVNHRYLDVVVRVPEVLRSLESVLRERFGSEVSRGKVEISLKHQHKGFGDDELIIDEALLERLSVAAASVQGLTKSKCVVDAVRLLQWPGVVGVSRLSERGAQLAAKKVFELALQDFLATRRREGRQLAALVWDRNEQLQETVVRLRERRPCVIARQHEKLKARIDSLGVDSEPSRLEQELAIAAQRLDIDEELDRLDAHCVELAAVLKRCEPVGRRLDFLMQEFNREANTIASKSADQQTTAMTVDMKVLIEQVREQVQNIE